MVCCPPPRQILAEFVLARQQWFCAAVVRRRVDLTFCRHSAQPPCGTPLSTRGRRRIVCVACMRICRRDVFRFQNVFMSPVHFATSNARRLEMLKQVGRFVLCKRVDTCGAGGRMIRTPHARTPNAGGCLTRNYKLRMRRATRHVGWAHDTYPIILVSMIYACFFGKGGNLLTCAHVRQMLLMPIRATSFQTKAAWQCCKQPILSV